MQYYTNYTRKGTTFPLGEFTNKSPLLLAYILPTTYLYKMKTKELLKVKFTHCRACRNNTISGHVFLVTETKRGETNRYIDVKDKKQYYFRRVQYYPTGHVTLRGTPCKHCGHLIPTNEKA